jgi:hypothetical protein
MTALWYAEPWRSLLVGAVDAGVAWGVVAVAPDLKASGQYPRRKCKGGA